MKNITWWNRLSYSFSFFVLKNPDSNDTIHDKIILKLHINVEYIHFVGEFS